MVFRESETAHLKEAVCHTIAKEIVAFANGNGGWIYVGVAGDGTVVGLDNPDQTALQTSSGRRDAVA